MVLPGSEPLALQRFYCSANPPEATFFKAWPFNHFKELGYVDYEDYRQIELHDSFGAVIPFEDKQVKPECLKKAGYQHPKRGCDGSNSFKK